MMTKQTYNFVAKRIREGFPTNLENTDDLVEMISGTLCVLALECAKGFLRDNPRFDAAKFLDACSPDPERYPISALWENELKELAQNGSQRVTRKSNSK